MSLELIEESIEKIAIKGIAQSAAAYGGLGGVVGAMRGKDKDESRLHAIGRSALTGAGLGAGIRAGGKAGLRLAGTSEKEFLNKASKMHKKMEGNFMKVKMSGPSQKDKEYIAKGLGASAVGTAVGGITGYQLSKRKGDKK